jgi:hypothetical protein
VTKKIRIGVLLNGLDVQQIGLVTVKLKIPRKEA